MKPEWAFKAIYFLKHREKLNLTNPATYNDKINWLKLNYRNELMPICADKYLVRRYVKECGYGHILNKLYWDGFDPNDIPFSKLPEQFVIKVTHGSGHNIICKSKNTLDIEKVKKDLRNWLNEKYLPSYGEWFYDVKKPRIIIEELLLDNNENIPEDYKLYCFNNFEGKHDVAFTAVDIDKETNPKRNLYSKDWKFMQNATISFENNKHITRTKPVLY